jgi:hypothetical protein
MKIEPKTILVIDKSSFGQIHLELSSNVNPEDLVMLPAFDIRDGLRTKYYKPHHRKESLVTINWLDIETPDELLVHLLNHFGKVKSNVKWSKIKEEEGESEIAKLLNNIPNGERQVWMEISKPLPSYAMIDKGRLRSIILAKEEHVQDVIKEPVSVKEIRMQNFVRTMVASRSTWLRLGKRHLLLSTMLNGREVSLKSNLMRLKAMK